jgi:hypothetical protein
MTILLKGFCEVMCWPAPAIHEIRLIPFPDVRVSASEDCWCGFVLLSPARRFHPVALLVAVPVVVAMIAVAVAANILVLILDFPCEFSFGLSKW